jgi:DNA-binding beta-propeller fold protein YncE
MRNRVFSVAVAGVLILFAPLSFAADLLSNTVLRYNGQTGASVGQFVTPGSGGLSAPWGVVFGPDGNLYVSSGLNDRVLRYDGQTGQFVNTFVAAGSGGLDFPTGLAFGPNDNHLYAANGFAANSSVRRYNGQTGAFINVFATGGIGSLLRPGGVVFGPDGNLYVVSRDSHVVFRYNGSTGASLGVFTSGGGLNDPVGLSFGPDGNLYVASRVTDNVLRFNGQTGAFIDNFVPEASGGLQEPHGLVFGPDGNLYVASQGTSSVLRYDGQTGAFLDTFVTAGSGGLQFPTFLTFFPSDPACDIRMSQNAYSAGETVTVESWRLRNPGPDPVAVEMKTWLGVPTSGAISIVNAGADGSLTLAAGFDEEFGPIDLFVVQAGFPSGTYEFSCRLLDPTTGQTKHEDLNPFEIP